MVDGFAPPGAYVRTGSAMRGTVSNTRAEFTERLNTILRIIRGLGVGVDPRGVQGALPKRSGDQLVA